MVVTNTLPDYREEMRLLKSCGKKGMSKNTAHCLEYLPEITSISLNHKNKMNTYLKCLGYDLKISLPPKQHHFTASCHFYPPSNCHPQIVFLKSVHCCPFCLSATDQLLATMTDTASPARISASKTG